MHSSGNEYDPFGVECFEDANPNDPLSEGDATMYFKRKKHAVAWIDKDLLGPRFKYIFLYKNDASGSWVHVDDFEAKPHFHQAAYAL